MGLLDFEETSEFRRDTRRARAWKLAAQTFNADENSVPFHRGETPDGPKRRHAFRFTEMNDEIAAQVNADVRAPTIIDMIEKKDIKRPEIRGLCRPARVAPKRA